jgi:hypothetical protein
VQNSLILALASIVPILLIRKRYRQFLGLIVVLFYLFLIRSSPPQLDMINYNNYLLNGNVSTCCTSMYYLREPLFWCGIPVIYQLLTYVGYESMSWWVVDVLVIMLVFRSLKEFKNRGVILFLLTLSLPSFLGVNNIYRQWIAMMLFIPAIVCFLDKRGLASIGWLLVSSLCHNSTLIFFPIIFFLISTHRLSLVARCFLFPLLSTLVIFMIFPAISEKSGQFQTGLNVAPALTSIVCLLAIVCYRPIAGVIGFINSGIFVCYISFVSIFVFALSSSGVSERLSYYFIFTFMVLFFLYKRLLSKKLFYFGFFTVNIVVILSTSSTQKIAFNYFN